MERLQKIMARAGVASRRKCEQLIIEGRVKLNNEVVHELGVKADPLRDEIEVSGKRLSFNEEKAYLILNKPAGYLTSVTDPLGRPTFLDLIDEKGVARLFPVGRLDQDTEGLLLVTNDGELAFRLTHPKYKVPKTYLAEVKGFPQKNIINCLSSGIMLEEGLTSPAEVSVVERKENSSVIEITIREGRKRQIRRMFEKVGHSVIRLKRIAFGPIKLKDLRLGGHRILAPFEVDMLKRATGLK
ncbi:MAG: pseudouridine synthase [Candidatus Subteraquimicrobiales bacterium]|nr:pseudouridine synthase [Candidatus Subteraquimicrobiales bacterium]